MRLTVEHRAGIEEPLATWSIRREKEMRVGTIVAALALFTFGVLFEPNSAQPSFWCFFWSTPQHDDVHCGSF